MPSIVLSHSSSGADSIADAARRLRPPASLPRTTAAAVVPGLRRTGVQVEAGESETATRSSGAVKSPSGVSLPPEARVRAPDARTLLPSRGPSGDPSGGWPSVSPRRRPPGWLVWLVALLAAATGLVAFAFTFEPRDPPAADVRPPTPPLSRSPAIPAGRPLPLDPPPAAAETPPALDSSRPVVVDTPHSPAGPGPKRAAPVAPHLPASPALPPAASDPSTPPTAGTATASTPTPEPPPGPPLLVDADIGGNREIALVQPGRQGVTNLTNHPASDRMPAWSPDRSGLAFVTNRDGNDEIYVMKADGSQVVRLTTDPASDTEPAWAPDGIHIAFVSTRDGNSELYTMKSDGTEPRRLTFLPSDEREPAWAPDGQRIAWVSDRAGNPDIYWMWNSPQTLVTRLTSDPGQDRQPDWSPDGRRIVFTRDRGGSFELYVMPVDGAPQSQLTVGSGWDPAWSQDGTEIAFVSSREGAPRPFVMRANGTFLRSVGDGACDRIDW
ncbi:MAG: hypothetical protein ACRDJ4_03410 [Actinomycetota bacterium]